jgi:hypothetical protein
VAGVRIHRHSSYQSLGAVLQIALRRTAAKRRDELPLARARSVVLLYGQNASGKGCSTKERWSMPNVCVSSRGPAV